MDARPFYSTLEFRDKILSDTKLEKRDLVILMCAIFIACIGLNLNNSVVLIGAMLISPLMLPIVGMGLGFSIYDFHLIKKSFRLLTTEIGISLLVSIVYFYLSPISLASAELIARTSPNIWDVMIAIAGGIAGVIGSRKKEANNIVPGVAIATALMPPICTVGYGIVYGNLQYIIGASYLFLLNAAFIMLVTFIGSHLMRHKNASIDLSQISSRMKIGFVSLFVLLTIPSIFSAGRLVLDYTQREAMSQFVTDQFPTHTILSKIYHKKTNLLEVTIVGEELSQEEIEEITSKQKDFGLESLQVKINQVAASGVDDQKFYQYIEQYIDSKLMQNNTNNEQIQDEVEVVKD